MKPINRAFTPIVGMALATKDGQRCGNGFVIGKETKTYTTQRASLNSVEEVSYKLYHILTDFGNVMKMTDDEVNELFDIANWWSQEEDNLLSGSWYDTAFMSPSARIKRQIELLTDVLKDIE